MKRWYESTWNSSVLVDQAWNRIDRMQLSSSRASTKGCKKYRGENNKKSDPSIVLPLFVWHRIRIHDFHQHLMEGIYEMYTFYLKKLTWDVIRISMFALSFYISSFTCLILSCFGDLVMAPDRTKKFLLFTVTMWCIQSSQKWWYLYKGFSASRYPSLWELFQDSH